MFHILAKIQNCKKLLGYIVVYCENVHDIYNLNDIKNLVFYFKYRLKF